MNIFTLTTIAALLACSPVTQAYFNWEDYYQIETIDGPDGVDFQIGGLDHDKNGNLIACFHRGEVMSYNETSKQWKLFASGLHEPLGIHVEDEGTVLVIQRGELTRLHDQDGDGTADFYEVVCNDWGLSGNYHEFTFGLVKDSKKNIYIALGTASNGSGVRENIRGEWNNTGGLTQDKFLYGGEHGAWNEKKKIIPRMYARVPYRGCILKITPGSRKAEVYATGVRTPNGLYMDKNDQLWVTDNQGDWVGASKLHHIMPDGFHGHVASLLWSKNPPKITPAELPVDELDALRVRAPGLFPQGDAGNSITQPLPLKPSFAPLSKSSLTEEQIIIGEMNHPRVVRYLPDVVNGVHQGTASHMIVTGQLDAGNNRLLYSRDGKSIYFGKTHLSWPGREGIKKVTYTGKPYLMVEAVKLTPKGFRFTFNAEIRTDKSAADFRIASYGFQYHSGYGSKKMKQSSEAVADINIDGNTLEIELQNKPVKNRMYDITLPSAITSKLSDLSYPRYWYMAHEVY
ncbi:hypothetical protein JO972_08360 [Verrucomicrobiaceae bacterium 5K15]|uniref:DUF7133 domain-containing protein n=1 Tax=Oceaniferula flava TaxID=2800421 RepID=A0AAE2VDS9_9BACT|nr:hypothetical protein [Oceaniferula flavus]MBK1854969.1 hypothetical protein [Oceaniferula flavus]MBM1136275.1 hypothetical protein [Oceaniferula flavus]